MLTVVYKLRKKFMQHIVTQIFVTHVFCEQRSFFQNILSPQKFNFTKLSFFFVNNFYIIIAIEDQLHLISLLTAGKDKAKINFVKFARV